MRTSAAGLLALSAVTLIAGCATGSPRSEASFQTVRSADVGLHTRVLGHGSQVVVLLHGGPGLSLQEMAPFDALLSPARRLIAFDQRGSGGTGRPASGTWALEAQVGDIEAIRRSAQTKRIWLIGQSWGGLLAGAYAAAHPDRVAGLALVDAAPPDVAAFDSGQQAFSRRLLQLQRDGLVPAALPGPAHGSCLAALTAVLPVYAADAEHPPQEPDGVTCTEGTAADTYAAVIRPDVLRPVAQDLARYRGPAVIVGGASDAFGPTWPRAWQQVLPQARSVRIERAGHDPVLERPQAVLAALGRFLSS